MKLERAQARHDNAYSTCAQDETDEDEKEQELSMAALEDLLWEHSAALIDEIRALRAAQTIATTNEDRLHAEIDRLRALCAGLVGPEGMTKEGE